MLLLLLLPVVYAASSCSDCGGQTCILDTTATSVSGGSTSVSLSFCNFDTSQNGSYSVTFGVSSSLSCDPSNATLPVLQSLTATDGCTPESCTVTAGLKEEIDWAIALQNNGVSNTLTAQLTHGGRNEVVTVGTFATMAAAVVNSATADVSVCASHFAVSGSRFSTVEKCNVVQICRGASTDTTCTTGVGSATVKEVSCLGESCSGTVALSESLPCDGSSGSTALLVGVTVGGSTQSNFASVGTMTTPNFSIADASGVDTGSSEVVLTTDTFCAYSSISLNVSVGDSSADSSAESVDVSSVNSTTNGTIVVELASPLSSTLSGDELQFSLSQCGVSATASFSVGEGSGDSSTISTGSTESSEDDDVATSSSGYVSTQEEDSSTGLSHSVIIGIVIAVVAIAGFVFECVNHKKRQAMPPPQDSTVSNLATPM